MTGFNDLPDELLIDVLSYTGLADLLSIKVVCRRLFNLFDDEDVWKGMIQSRFKNLLKVARDPDDWQGFYKALTKGQIFQWDTVVGRWPHKLSTAPGHLQRIFKRTRISPFPLEVSWRYFTMLFLATIGESAIPTAASEWKSSLIGNLGVPIQISADEISTYILTCQGNVLIGNDKIIQSADKHPVRLLNSRRARVTQMAAGSYHCSALLDNGKVLDWVGECLNSVEVKPFPDYSSCKIVKVDAGPGFTAILTKESALSKPRGSGATTIKMWMTAWTTAQYRWDKSNGRSMTSTLSHGIITLPPLADKIVQIAAGRHFVVAMTENIDVFMLVWRRNYGIRIQLASIQGMYDNIEHASSKFQHDIDSELIFWKSLGNFSEVLRTLVDSQIHTSGIIKGQESIAYSLSAELDSFAVVAFDCSGRKAEDEGFYKGAVLLYHMDSYAGEDTVPEIIPELQGRCVIKVTIGHVRYAALTIDGYVLTWGTSSRGAEGNWDYRPLDPFGEDFLRYRGMQYEHFEPIWGPQICHTKMVEVERRRYRARLSASPELIATPKAIRFGFPVMGSVYNGIQVAASDDFETKFAMDIAMCGNYSCAITIDRALLEQG